MPAQSAKTLLHCKLEKKFNDLKLIEKKSTGFLTLITGDEDGAVNIYKLPASGIHSSTQQKPQTTIESKGGPIQAVQVCDLSRLDTNDIIVADSKGLITVFHNEQIIYRNPVSDGCITCMDILKDPLGSMSVITGDNLGHIAAFSLYDYLWKIKSQDIKLALDLPISVTIECVFAADLPLPNGQVSTLVLASNNCRHLYIIHQGIVVKVLRVPSVVTSMCSGRFINSKLTDENLSRSPTQQQVALGCQDGAVFILEDLELASEEFVNIKLPIAKVVTVQQNTDSDTLICAGHFNGVCIVQNAQSFWQFKTTAWVNSVLTEDIDEDGMNEVILGCGNGEVMVLKL